MKTPKSIISIIIIVTMLITLATTSFALSPLITVQQKAQVLDQLTILKGSNGDYKLNDKLLRSEAAALVVRLLGKEFHVLVEQNTYKKTAYPDVDENAWFAPYVGFCTKEGILSGDTKGYFNPNEHITEKAFIKIMLGVLGYEFNKDYIWDGVYKKAFEVNLVTDLSYIIKTDDNTNFTRADAVSIIYNALTLKTKTEGKELFYKLIDSGMVTYEKAVEIGLLESVPVEEPEQPDSEDEEETEEEPEDEKPKEDEIETEIEEVNVFDYNNISVHFNEDIKGIGGLKIYEASNKSKLLGYRIDTIEKNYIFLITERQTPGVEYIIEITDIEDMDGFVIDELKISFTSYSPETVESLFFRIKKIEPVNEKSIMVYFTHPINLNAENPLYYKITEGNYTLADGAKDQLLPRIHNSAQNSVLVTLKADTFTEGEEYTIEIDGNMTSAYGANLNLREGDRMGFIAKAGKEERFKLEQIIPFNENTLMLIFNKEVNPFLANQIYNFYITDRDNKPLVIEKSTTEGPYVSDGEVLFISINGRFKKGSLYYLTINNLNDITRQEYITETTYSFEADYGEKEELEIAGIESINNQTVEVYFTGSLDPVTATDARNYSVRYRSGSRIYPQAVYYDQKEDPNKVVLYFSDSDKLVGNREYELQVSRGLKDNMGNEIREALKEEFTTVSKNKKNLSIEEVIPVSSDVVKVVFNGPIAFDKTNLSPDNYSLEYNIAGMNIKEVPISILYYNSRTLIMKFNEMEYDLPYTLKFNTLVDYFGTSFKVTGDGTNYVEFKLQREE